jgi:hypothetical protein
MEGVSYKKGDLEGYTVCRCFIEKIVSYREDLLHITIKPGFLYPSMYTAATADFTQREYKTLALL